MTLLFLCCHGNWIRLRFVTIYNAEMYGKRKKRKKKKKSLSGALISLLTGWDIDTFAAGTTLTYHETERFVYG